MAVFTFYGYGTGENHRETTNIISQFSKASTATEPNRVLIKDGPSLLGTEVPVNAQNGADAIIEWLKEQENDDNTVNLTGFSRGSVTCIRIANILKRKQIELENQQPRSADDEKLLSRLKNIDLNLFLVDPVAGITDKKHPDGKTIPDNVSNCVTVLQKDERRRDFKPQDITRLDVVNPSKTRVSMLPMYGNHSDTTKIKNKGMDSGPTILWHALHHFLTQHGSTFKDNELPHIINSKKETSVLEPINNPKELLKVFSAHHEQREQYYQSGLTSKLVDGIPAPRAERTLNNHTRYYVKSSAFFVNQLERELFKLAYPKTFNYLFEQNIKDPRFPNDSNCSKEQVIAELAQIQQDDPSLFNRLQARGVKVHEEQIILGKPQGYKTLESCSTAMQILPDLVPEAVKATVAEMDKLSALENEVYRFTFRYERDKSEFNFAGQRNKAETAQQIRQEINDIVNNSPLDANGNEDRNGKYQQVLDKLEQHYKTLILANSTSELVGALGDTLAAHGRQYAIKEGSVLNQCLVEFAHAGLSLVTSAVGFAGNLGYVGGSTLYAVGNALESIGARANELIGDIGWNPVKALASIVATTLEVVGFAVKNSFGLKPLTNLLTSGLNQAKSWLLNAINSTSVERVEQQQLRSVLDEVRRAPGLDDDAQAPLVDPSIVSDTQSMRARMAEERNHQQRQPLLDEVRLDSGLDDSAQVSLVDPGTVSDIQSMRAQMAEGRAQLKEKEVQEQTVLSDDSDVSYVSLPG